MNVECCLLDVSIIKPQCCLCEETAVTRTPLLCVSAEQLTLSSSNVAGGVLLTYTPKTSSEHYTRKYSLSVSPQANDHAYVREPQTRGRTHKRA